MSLRIVVTLIRKSGKPLKGELGEFWRYRQWEIIAFLCEIRR
ncbi:hypothetical protein [Klebsiella pneumoniae]|nr:hypothetical protein [Klebsiella pneumoniae]